VTDPNDINTFIQCANKTSIYETSAIYNYYGEDVNSDNVTAVIKEDFNDFIDAIDYCVQAYQLQELIFAPLFQAFYTNPGNFIVLVVRNILVNAPDIEIHVAQEVKDVLAGQYSNAATDELGIARDAFRGFNI